ncbi:MAG: hypothetical protein SNJ61_12490 [Fimbriimonadaceae bacterium]
MTIQSRIGIALVALAAGAFAYAQTDGISLVRQVKVGDTKRFKMSFEIDIMGMMAVYSATQVETVREVREDGSYIVQSTQNDVKIVFGDQDLPVDNTGSLTTVFERNGMVRSVESSEPDMGGSAAFRIANMTSIVVPDTPVNVGSKWEQEIRGSAKTDNVGGKATYSVVATERVAGIETLVIEMRYVETSGEAPATAEGRIWLDVRDGSLVKLTATLRNAPFPQAPAPIDARLTIERIP